MSRAQSHISVFIGPVSSLFIHAAVVLGVSLSLRGCQKSSHGDPGGDVFRDVGLFVVDGQDGGRSDDGTVAGSGHDAATNREHAVSETPSEHGQPSPVEGVTRVIPNEAPDLASLLNSEGSDATDGVGEASTLPRTIGPGSPIGGLQSPRNGGGGSQANATQAGGTARIGGVPGPGETSFMNIVGVGQTVVYVIDTSSSMDGSRLKVAQGQLKASLRLLQQGQKFAVILYNEHPTFMTLRGRPKQSLFAADDLTKSLAVQAVDRVLSDSGTDHKPALLMALGMEPDVIYFLTDGDQPELYPGDLEEIGKRTGSTTIHVIKFGDGTVASRGVSWLERLAQQSHGEFREINAR